MYNIKITLPHKTTNHTKILSLGKCYALIMDNYRHLKYNTNEDTFSILLWDEQGKILRITNDYVCGVQDVARGYIGYKMMN